MRGQLSEIGSNPWLNPKAFDTITLDKKASPGLCIRASGGDRKVIVEQQRSPGFGGAFTVVKGEVLSQITYQFVFWLPEHFKAAQEWIAMLRAGQKKKPNRVYALVDLTLTHNEIKQVIVENITRMQTPGSQKIVYEVTFAEYKKKAPIGGVVAPPAKNAVQAAANEFGYKAGGQEAKLQALESARANGEGA